MARLRNWLAAAGVLALAASLTACAGASDEPAATGDDPYAGQTIKIGVVGASDEYWQTYVDAAAAEGIEVELVDFADYNQPNPALSAGEVQLNQFQHILYLANYNESAGDDLTAIGATAIYPLGLYSDTYDSVEDIPEGGKVGVPNDETNRARALLVLQSAGLIELEDGGNAFSTLDDIVTENSKVTVEELNADLLANSLQDFDAAIINNDFIADAGLEADDAIAQDDPSDPAALAYVNIFASKAEDADNPTLNKLVEIYQTNEEVQQGVLDNSGGTAEMLTTPKEELQEQLAQVQEDIRNEG
ncbi:MetQ/NlpA family ABC transporter substrate-binding protein [Gulosibacter faecalis]|jgi:D-methionine transport system substrate-binding protein|uniref:MetQ/NlpA family ABC transporter substrate-binding protein n=1 Tax=Gulosibacter faecalis TaxID=272240 RepID=A0ABW5UXD2_9MICO|nr:MetQ/NlpA family ABC transporter substrate-binding protein [Gulosibacter faecalis]